MASRKKGCEWCEEEIYGDTIEHPNGFLMWLEVYPFNNFMSVTCQANNEEGEAMEDDIQIPMNYCPNCGRKLV